MLDLDAVKRSNPLAATVEQLTGQPIVRHKIAAPWREERTPSLHIYEDGRWKDFGDGSHGDVLDFVGRYYFGSAYNPSVHLPDVIDRLGGLGITPLPPTKQEAPRPKPKPQLTISKESILHWHESMPVERREWWYSRGLMDPVIDQFRLGWDGKRYTIPHFYRGVPFGVKRRQSDVDDGIAVKYTAIKGSRAGIFNADALAVEKNIVICEGEIDAMLLTQYGYPAVSCTTGAGGWKAEWARFLGGVVTVNILYDNDAAGREGRRKVWNSLRRANIVTLPDGINDIGELIEQHPFPVTWLKENLA